MSSPGNESKTTTTARQRWLSIVGIGEDGLSGLSPTARGLIESAEFVVGGKRHLALAESLVKSDCLAWPSPITGALEKIAAHSGRQVVILASGDPFHYGVGTMIAKHFPAGEILCLPQPSAFSLAASRLGWSQQHITPVTLHGRALEGLNRHLLPGARILALSWDETTPQKAAMLLRERGLGKTMMTILESLAGPSERIRQTQADQFNISDITPLNMIALELPKTADANESTHTFAHLTPGLDDDAFDHDGQLTKRDVRAITISALAPSPGERLWDIGLGAGSIAIEWLLCHPSLHAIGFEKDKTRAARALANAAALGTPELEVVTGAAPDTFKDRPPPDVVFIGGGLSNDSVFEAAWSALRPAGRLVANAVTLESEARLADLHTRHGGELIKIDISRAAPIGTMRGWRTAMPVVQWRVVK